MDAPRALFPLTMALVVALGAAVGFGWAWYRLLVDRGRLLLRLEDLAPAAAPAGSPGHPPGAFLNDFALPVRDGRIVTLSELAGTVLVVVVQANCLYSRAFAAELRRLPRDGSSPLPVLILSGVIDNPEELTPFSDLPGLLLLDQSGLTARLLRIAATPAGYQSVNRRTLGPRLVGPVALIAAARGEAGMTDEQRAPLAVTPVAPDDGAWRNRKPMRPGEMVPDVTRSGLGGDDWSPRSELGSPWFLLLIDSLCPPCQRVLADLEGPFPARLVIASRGEMPDHDRAAALQLGARVVTQQRPALARALGVVQTPAVYAIDAGGRIVAGPAIGYAAARELLADYASPHGIPLPAVIGTHDRGGRGNG
ncbi:MAG: hypothetical protein U0031_07125 [Thermomicrobiales bacterium]